MPGASQFRRVVFPAIRGAPSCSLSRCIIGQVSSPRPRGQRKGQSPAAQGESCGPEEPRASYEVLEGSAARDPRALSGDALFFAWAEPGGAAE